MAYSAHSVRAAVCYGFGQPLVVEDIAIDRPAAGEVKVRIAATAICHSDIHLLHGEWPGVPPIVAGHEAAGVVEETGSGVTRVEPGDRVVVSLLRSCGECFHCRRGAAHMCEGRFALATESRLRNARGEAVHPGIFVGAFAEFAIVHESQVVRLPPRMPLDRAALLGCGVITGFGAVINTARVREGESVVVIGAGGVGINAIQAAAMSRAYPIVAVDRVDSKLESARAFGATHVVKDDVRATVKSLTKRGADYVFVTVGATEALPQALSVVRAGGSVVVVGMPEWKATAPVRVADLVWNEQRVIGCRMGSTRLDVDVPHLVDRYLAGELKLDELITARYSLERINDAIAAMESGAALRNLIEM
jgi:S-(hydroxymethyl)glutathione dehydrogenase / alcohol dehydrogenase